MLTEEQARGVWQVLQEECGAGFLLDSQLEFVHHATRRSPLEFRFQGALGFGGKVYLPDYRVSCYREDETAARRARIDRANARLAQLREQHAAVRAHPAV